MKKLSYVLAIDRFDYFSGMNHSFHSLAQILHDLGEDVYTFGIGKPGFSYKIFKINNYNPIHSCLSDIKNIDLKLNNLDPESTVFITTMFDLPILDEFKNRVVWIETFDTNYKFNDDYLYFYNVEGYCKSKRKHSGLIRFFDVDPDFWQPSNDTKEFNTFLVKKLFRKQDINVNTFVCENLVEISKFADLPFKQIDDVAGQIQYMKDSYDIARPIQRDLWRKSDYFISFDQNTVHAIFSTLCGAKTIIVPKDDTYTPDEFRELFYPYTSVGIAYGINDMDYMMNSKDKIREHCKESHDVYINDARNLVKVCSESF